jgi:hypothetical protein
MNELVQLFMAAVRGAGNTIIPQILWGRASDVRERTCTLKREDSVDIEGVLLTAINDDLGTSFTVYPKENSIILVGVIECLPQTCAVLLASEVEKVVLKTNNGFSFNAGNGKVEIKNGTANLKDILTDIVDKISGLTIMTADGEMPVSVNSQTQINILKTQIDKLLS